MCWDGVVGRMLSSTPHLLPNPPRQSHRSLCVPRGGRRHPPWRCGPGKPPPSRPQFAPGDGLGPGNAPGAGGLGHTRSGQATGHCSNAQARTRTRGGPACGGCPHVDTAVFTNTVVHVGRGPCTRSGAVVSAGTAVSTGCTGGRGVRPGHVRGSRFFLARDSGWVVLPSHEAAACPSRSERHAVWRDECQQVPAKENLELKIRKLPSGALGSWS